MGLDFVKQVISIGGATTEPALRFYRKGKGFNLGGSGSSPSWQDIILSGNGSLTLANAKANGLNYLKLFGGTEQIASGNVGTAYIANTTTEVTGDITNVPRTDLSTPAVSLLKSGNITTDNVPDVDWTKDWELLVENTKITASNDIGNAISVYLNGSVAIQIYPYSGLKLYGVCYIDGSQTSYSDTITLNTNYDFRISYEERSGLRAIYIDYKLSSSDTWTPLLQKNITLTQPTVSYIGLSSRWNDKISMPISLSNVTFTNDGIVKYSSSASSTPTPDAPMDIVCNNGVLKVRHQSGLPLGYQPYEYITASGNQWLNTGLKLESTDVVETEFKNSSSSGFGALYGVFAMGDSSAFYANGTYYGYDVANGKVDTRVSVDTNWHTLRHDFVNGVITLDGNNTTYTPFEFDNAKDNYLFARYYSNSYGYGFKGSCKRYKVIRNGVLICDLIPVVQLSDNAVGMYDLVNNVFRDNLGTGAFNISNPINDLELYVDGTVETVQARSKNIFNKNDTANIGGWYVGANQTILTANSNETIVMRAIPNAKYYFKHCSVKGGGRAFYTEVEDWDINSPASEMVGSAAVNDNVTNTITVSANAKWVFFNYGRSGQTASFEEQRDDYMVTIEPINSSTIYEPYFNGGTATAEPLLAVGDYKDIQEVKTGSVTRNVGIKIFDGTENWEKPAGSDYFRLDGMFEDAIPYSSNNPAIVCSHFVGRPPKTSASNMNDKDIKLGYTSTYNRLYLKYDAMVTADDLKAWLANQYANGTPVIVVYPIGSPTTETVTGQPLTIQAGTNIVEITQASIDNLPLEVSYKGTV